MKAGRIHHFGPPNAILIDEIPRPTPQEGELVAQVAVAGVGPWDALIREGKSVVQLSLPIILGSDLAGTVDSVGTGVIGFKPGDRVFGSHFHWAKSSEYVTQVTAIGPLGLEYVRAGDDPRNHAS